MLQVENVDPTVDFGDLPLNRGGVLVLDYRRNRAIEADDSAVPVRPRHDGGQNGRRSSARPVVVHQGPDGFDPHERDIAGQEQDTALFSREEWLGLEQRVARSELGLLDSELHVCSSREMRTQRFGLMTNNYYR
jgi:hypothetical protein